MAETDNFIDHLLSTLVQKLRPVIIEAVKDGFSINNANEADKPPEEGLMTVSEVMAFFKCSKATIYNYQKTGKIKSYRIGNRVYYKKADLLKGLKERNFKSQK